MMLRRILFLDALLAASLIAGGFWFRRQWLEFEATHRVDAVQAEAEPIRTLPAPVATAASSIGDWTVIPEKNPFSFDRNDIAIVTQQGKDATGPKPILFGTIAFGAERMAMMAKGQPGNRSNRAMKVGESIDQWRIVEIHEKSVVVEADGVRETIIMNDPSAKVPRDHTRTLASGSAAQSVVVQPQDSATGAAPQSPVVPRTAPGAAGSPPPGQPKGRFIETPFGRVFVADPPK